MRLPARTGRIVPITLILLLIVWILAARVLRSQWQQPAEELYPPPATPTPLPAGLYEDCALDPAPVPPPPPGPDGRPAVYLHTCLDRLYDALGNPVRITGLNWFGMETDTYSPHGLWTRNWQSLLDQIARLGYNAVRIPFTNEMLEPGKMPLGINYYANPDLQGLTPVEILDRVVAGARERGLRVVLDRHRPTSSGQSALWYTDDVPEERWIADWVFLARRYLGNDTVIGADLHNEPRGEATWGTGEPTTDWRLAAERAGNAILEVNPYWLIFVQGVERQGDDWYWWGGNLAGARDAPVRLRLPNRLVYSPHDYGPGVYDQPWFSAPNFPDNLPDVWDSHWGYLQAEGLAPVVLGEFGGRSVDDDADGRWQRRLLSYLQSRGMGYFQWSLNPNSSDTGGLLREDWLNTVQERYRVYRAFLAPPIGMTSGASFGPLPARPKVLYRSAVDQQHTSAILLAVQIANFGGEEIDLRRVEVHYWFSSDGLEGPRQLAEVEYAAIGPGHVRPELVPAAMGGQDYFVRLTFDGGTIPPYGNSGEVLVRIYRSDGEAYDQSNDYSYSPGQEYREWDRIALYLDGRLVWGSEPGGGAR